MPSFPRMNERRLTLPAPLAAFRFLRRPASGRATPQAPPQEPVDCLRHTFDHMAEGFGVVDAH